MADKNDEIPPDQPVDGAFKVPDPSTVPDLPDDDSETTGQRHASDDEDYIPDPREVDRTHTADRRELRPRTKFKTSKPVKLTREEILQRMKGKPSGTSTPRTTAEPSRVKFNLGPLSKQPSQISIETLLKVPSLPATLVRRENVETGTKSKATRSISEHSEMEEEDFDITTIPYFDRNYYNSNPEGKKQDSPAKRPLEFSFNTSQNPTGAFASDIGKTHRDERTEFSTASQAMIDKLIRERDDVVKLVFKVHTDDLNDEESNLLTKYLTEDQIEELNAKTQATRRALGSNPLEFDIPTPKLPGDRPSFEATKRRVDQNLKNLTKRVYRDLEPSKFKSRYSSVANDRSFKPNLLNEARTSVLRTVIPEELEGSIDFSVTEYFTRRS